MKYFLILLIFFSCLSYAAVQEDKPWVLGKYSINLKQPCDVQVKTAHSIQDISNVFGKNTICNIANLSQTNIPNTFVIGGGYILIIERRIITAETCRRISKALYLPNTGDAILSKIAVKSGNCDGHIEANSAMYMISPHIKVSS